MGEEKKHKLKIIKYLPELLALILCLLVLGGFVLCKEGYHMDELLSFELANAEFTPWIVPTQPVGRLEKFVVNEIRGGSAAETWKNIAETIKDVIANRGSSKMLSYTADVYDEPVWIDRQQFIDYITVGEEDDFNYFSVYFNVKDDNHPPLHFMLLHTVSSIFKGSITPVMGCSVNLAAAAGILVLIMKLGEIYARAFAIDECREFKLTAALFYGLSAGAVATVLLIRMYALVTFFCIAYFYIHVKKWYEGDFGSHNKLLVMVTVLGFLTQYFFLFYCFALALVTMILILRSKRYRDLFVYIRTMLISAAVGLIAFPFAVSDVFSSGRGVEALGNLAQGISGYGERIAEFAEIVIESCGGYRVGVLFAVAVILSVAGLLFIRDCVDKKSSALLWMLFVPPVVYFFLAARMAPYRVDRYMMPIFPFVLFSLILIIFLICRHAKRCGTAVAVLLVLLQAMETCNYDGDYLYTGYSGQLEVAEENADSACICVYAGVGYYENLVEFTDYEKTLLVTLDELNGRSDTESITELERVVVLVKYGVSVNDVENVMEEKYGFGRAELLYSTGELTSDTVMMFAKR